jgi:hypothetical protein
MKQLSLLAAVVAAAAAGVVLGATGGAQTPGAR